jgi:Putative zinc binding domain
MTTNSVSAHSRRTVCRACATPFDAPFLQLGPMPLANNLPRTPAEVAAQARYPLDVCVCRMCSLVQTPDVIDPAVLFAHYVYLTGMSETMRTHNKGYAAHVVSLLGAGAADLVVDIASNDGSLLAASSQPPTLPRSPVGAASRPRRGSSTTPPAPTCGTVEVRPRRSWPTTSWRTSTIR